jgi:WD40 repeat protein/serine/threonine protein kinase/tetratricopeptide (TPR) repeat protein
MSDSPAPDHLSPLRRASVARDLIELDDATANEGQGCGGPDGYDATLNLRNVAFGESPELTVARMDEAVGEETCVRRPEPNRPAVPVLDLGVSHVEIPGYEIRLELGRGGMGVVYLARQLGLNRLVALKMILSGAHADRETQKRFLTEAEAVAQLVHPGIIQIYEIGIHENRPYFSLEYADGGSLAAQLLGQPQAPADAARLIETLARAIHFAHERGIVHRDLKPANILLVSSGKQSTHHSPLITHQPKITDFGLAKRVDDAAGMTQSGIILGTPSYMAPEQAAGRTHEAGPAADIYALGVILYEMLTGRPPFRAAAEIDTVMLVLNQEPVLPSRLQPGVPRDLETICLKCLQKDPERRYESAAALAEDLRRFRQGEPIQARPVSALELSWRWCRRKPALAGLTASLIVLFVASFIIVTTFWFAAVDSRTEAETKAHEAGVERGKSVAALRGEAQALAHGKLQLAQMDVAGGSRLLDEGDLLGSLLWFADAHRLENEALANEPQERERRERRQRERWAAVMQQSARLLQVWAHGSQLTDATLSRDGKRLATANTEFTARVWDAATGKPLTPPLCHEGKIAGVSFNPEGTLLATCGHDKLVRVWNTATGQLVKEFTLGSSSSTVAFSPDGRYLMAVNDENRALVWDANTWQDRLTVVHKAGCTGSSWSADSRWLVTTSEDHTCRITEVATGEPRFSCRLQDAWVARAALSPDGGRLVIRPNEGPLQVWDVATGKRLPIALTHEVAVHHIAFSSDSRRLITADDDGTARVWEAATGRRLHALRHGGTLLWASFSPSGGEAVTAGVDGSAKLWDLASGLALTPPLRHSHRVLKAEFALEGARLLTVSADGTARLWDIRPSADLVAFTHLPAAVKLARYSPDGKRVLTVSQDRTARVWDAATGKPLSPPMRHEDEILDAAFHPSGKLIATGGGYVLGNSRVGQARIWDVERGVPVHNYVGEPARRVGFTQDGRYFYVQIRFFTYVWDWQANKLVPRMENGAVMEHTALSPDGQRIATSGGNTFRVWETATGKRLSLETLQNTVGTCFSPDGRLVAAVSSNRSAVIWDVDANKTVTPELRHDGAINQAEFSPTGERVITASDDRTARVWSATTGQALTPALRHEGKVSLGLFHPDGQRVATVTSLRQDGREEGRVRLWDADSGQVLTPPLRHPGRVHHAEFSPDGAYLLTACEDGVVRRWDVRALLDDSNVDMARLAQVLSCHTFESPLGNGRLATGPLMDAWQECRSGPVPSASDEAPSLFAWHRRQAEQAEANRQWSAAVFHLNHLLQTDAENVELRQRRGYAHLALREWQAAGDDLAVVARLQSDNAEARAYHARALAHQGETDKALSEYADLLATSPHPGPLHLARSFVHERLGNQRAAADDYAKALTKAGMRLEPKTLWNQRTRGLRENERAAWEELAADCSRQIDSGAGEVWLYRGRGLAYLALGQWKEAAADFDKAVAGQPADAEAYAGRARARAELDELGPAFADWSKARERNPGDWSLWFVRGWELSSGNLHAQALAAYSRAIELQSDTTLLRVQRASTHAELGEWQKAIDDLDQAGGVLSNVSGGYLRASIYLGAGRLDDFRAARRRLLKQAPRELQPQDANTLAWLGAFVPGDAEERREVIRLAELAVKARPRLATFRNTLGTLLYRDAQWQAALDQLNEAVRLHGEGGTAHDWLVIAMAHERLQQQNDAKKAWENALRLLAPSGDPAVLRPAWDQRLELGLLRQEAQNVLGISKSSVN